MARYAGEVAGLTQNQGKVQATKVAPLGYMGEFGSGLWRVFLASGNFTIPAGVKEIRVRVVGGGGGAKGTGCGGGGGGYAHGVFPVTPGEVYAVTVSGKNLYAGGTSSFGALISATGGAAGSPSYNSVHSNFGGGGIGVGGDFQARGGSGGTGPSCGGGGGSGSQLGNGGNAYGRGGAGVGGNGDAPGDGGGSPFGPNYHDPSLGGLDAVGNAATVRGAINPSGALIRFPFDGFTGGGGALLNTSTTQSTGYAGGPGAGGGGARSPGNNDSTPATGTISSGLGGVGGGGGGGSNGGNGTANGGIGGGAGNGNGDNYGGGGLVVVEY